MAHQASHALPDEDVPSPDKHQSRRTTGVPEHETQPRAGKTGLGARAERPSEGSKKPPAHQPGRGAKAPSARSSADVATPHQD